MAMGRKKFNMDHTKVKNPKDFFICFSRPLPQLFLHDDCVLNMNGNVLHNSRPGCHSMF